ncbi:hypothetical protein ACTFIW_004694 [Dictyostelium discoideum]
MSYQQSKDQQQPQQQQQQKYLIPVKCVLIGPTFSGKTSLVVRLVRETFSKESQPTVGAMFLNKTFQFSTHFIKLEVWDTAGQEKFNSLAPMYFKKSKVAIIVFDLSDRQSFVKAKMWNNEFKTHATEPAIMILIGNKCDLNKTVLQSDIDDFIREEKENSIDFTYFEASAKENTNVNNIFETIASKIPWKEEIRERTEALQVSPVISKKKKCCK